MAKLLAVENYMASLPPTVRPVAQTLRETILAVDANLTETIRYDMPAYQLGSKTIIYFAIWKKHIGLYPIYRGSEAFEARVAVFRAKTDSIRLALASPVPWDLVELIVRSQLEGAAKGA